MLDNEIHVATEVAVYLQTVLTEEISRWGANLDSKLDVKNRVVPDWPARCSVSCVCQECWMSKCTVKGTCDKISNSSCSLNRRFKKIIPKQ
jgi:hypothetical protein